MERSTLSKVRQSLSVLEECANVAITGIAYQLTEADPLIDTEQCQRDAELMVQLGTNAIRVYHVDPSGSHSGCMSAFAEAGIYLLVDLDTFNTAIDPVRSTHLSPKSRDNTDSPTDSRLVESNAIQRLCQGNGRIRILRQHTRFLRRKRGYRSGQPIPSCSLRQGSCTRLEGIPKLEGIQRYTRGILCR